MNATVPAVAGLLLLAACPLVRLPEGDANGGASSGSGGTGTTSGGASGNGTSGAGATSGETTSGGASSTSGATGGSSSSGANSGSTTGGATVSSSGDWTGSSGSTSGGQSSSSGTSGSSTSGGGTSGTSGTSGAPGTCPDVWSTAATANPDMAPHALATDGAGHLFATEEGSGATYRVVQFSLDDLVAPPLAIDGGFAEPTAVATDGQGNLWIADRSGAAAEVDVATGSVLRSIPAPDSLCAGGEAIAWDPVTQTAYLAGLHQLWVLAGGAWHCFWPGQCGSAGTCQAQWQFGWVSGLASDLDGGLLVSDYSWSCVVRLDLDAGTVTALGGACQQNTGAFAVYGANGIALDEKGRIFASVYPPVVNNPAYLPALDEWNGSDWTIAGDADGGCPMDLRQPEGLAPAPGGGVFVADTIGNIYRYTP